MEQLKLSRPETVEQPWALSALEVLEKLASDRSAGLAESDVASRREAFGKNELPESESPSLLFRFFAQFKDVTVLTLVVAALVAAILGTLETSKQSWLARYSDTFAIVIIVLLNGIVGVVQEGRARSALAALRKLSTPYASVIRDGKERRLAVDELVVGDIVLVREGDRVPADSRLVEVRDLTAGEAVLTGESLPVEKRADVSLERDTDLAERKNMLFMSTVIQQGSGVAVVTATGAKSEMGSLATMLEGVKTEKTPLEHQLMRFGKRVALGCAVLAVITFGFSVFVSGHGIAFALLLAVSLAVAAIPEGLPAVTTVVLALGVRAMAAKNAIVRKLSAVEALGSVHVICSDKTGTLTQNQMAVRRMWSPLADEEVDADQHARDAPFARLLFATQFAPSATLNDAGKATGEPTDAALLEFHSRHESAARGEVVGVVSFSSERKRSSTAFKSDDESLLIAHGAPEAILSCCSTVLGAEGLVPLDDAATKRVEEALEKFSGEGLRVLGFAERRIEPDASSGEGLEQDMTLLGLVALSDPPRPEVKAAIEKAKRGGVRTMMITGDHPTTAGAIARELHILRSDGLIVTSKELGTWSEDELVKQCAAIDVVARATPSDKLRVVRALARRGDAVAMTGDGVNDAAAIKAAEVGIAMGKGGTDATREVADLVLADDNYATIVVAIEYGRGIYANIQRFVAFLFAVNLGLVLVVFSGMLLGWPPLVTPTQILWINLITNGLPALALGMEPNVGDPMASPPRAKGAPLLEARAWARIAVVGVWFLGIALWAFDYVLAQRGERIASTVAFSVLAIGPIFYAFSARSSDSIFKLPPWTNSTLIGAALASALLQGIAVYAPFMGRAFSTEQLGLSDVGLVLALSLSVLVPAELFKLITLGRGSERPVPGKSPAEPLSG